MKKAFILLLFIAFVIELPAQDIGKNFSVSEKSIQLSPGITLEYAEQGDPTGIPVIFLHGVTDSWHSFESVLKYLPKNVHAFAISQRGHGNSSKPDSGYAMRDFANDVALLINKLHLEPVIIVGHSMGGVVAQKFVLDYPQLTRGVILIDTDASFRENNGMLDFYNEVLKLTNPISRDFASDFQKATLAKPINASQLNTFVSESLKVPAHVWKAAFTGFLDVNYTKELKNINKPVLIMWGDKDAFCFSNDQDILAAGIKNAELVVYEETGHALHWEQPERFAGDVINFVEKVSNDSN